MRRRRDDIRKDVEEDVREERADGEAHEEEQNLAQEGLELIRNYRSNNVLEGRSWTAGMNTCSSANGCRIDAVDLDIRNCTATCDLLKFDTDLHVYNYDTGSDSIFTRVIRLQDITPDEVKVTSLVTWSDRFGSHSFDISTSMFNW